MSLVMASMSKFSFQAQSLRAKLSSILSFQDSAIVCRKSTIQWTTLSPNEIKLDVVNAGPDPVTIAQVMIDEAYWMFSIEPEGGVLAPRQRGVVRIPYPWVEGEAHEVVLVSRNGVTFGVEIPVALASPTPSWHSFKFFGLLGVIIGVIPVALGLLWYPVVRSLSERWVRFLLAFTVGLLLFLGIDTLHEGLEIAWRRKRAGTGGVGSKYRTRSAMFLRSYDLPRLSTMNCTTALRSSGVSPTGRTMRVLKWVYFESGTPMTP